ncbi:MAG: C-terminal binding protein, partial [Thermoplasmatales archaeon]|nr:C-terminal binding protein [Thermoplasmatales archaeon]
MSKYKVYITDYDYKDNEIEKSILEPIGAEVIGLQCKDGIGVADQAKDADALMVQYANINRQTIVALPNLKIIARYGVGTDIIDIPAATERGIVCTNVVDYCTDEVADHNISFILMLVRRLPMYVAETKKSAWHWSETGRPVHRFTSLHVGTIGFGRISRNMCRKLRALGFQVGAYDPYVSSQTMEAEQVLPLEFNELISSSDVVVLQCPYNADTHHIIGKDELKSMKDGAILINSSRGKLVDNSALYDALKSGHIAAAGLDELGDEPAQ